MYRIFFILALSLMTSATIQARSVYVHAGRLQNLFNTYDLMYESELKLTGTINGTDVKLLRKWASEYRILDLTGCRIVAGGEPYYDDYTTEDDAIGSYMFGDVEFKMLILPKDLKKIGNYAISFCGENLELPPTLEWLGDHAFVKNEFKKLHLPASLVHIGNGALNGNRWLYDVTLDENNPEFVLEDGYLYTRDHTRLLSYFVPNDSTAKSLTIRPEVLTIDDNAFNSHGCENITLNEGLQRIGAEAFCNTLIWTAIPQKLVIPNSVSYIGTQAFANCNIETLIMPDNIEEIQPSTFKACSIDFIHLPANLKHVGAYAFASNSLDDLVLPEGLETIDEFAFENVDVNNLVIPSSVRNLAPKAFWYTLSDTIVIKAPLDSIPNACFYGCQSLNKLILPPTIKRIGGSVFYECYDLEDCKLPEGLEEIGIEAFAGADNMKEWHIPASVRKIELGAFFVPNFTVHHLYMYSKEPPADVHPEIFWDYMGWKSWNMDESVLYVPEGSKENYQHEPWSRFGTIKEFSPTAIRSPQMNGKQTAERCFDLMGRPVSKNSRVLRIVITPNGPVKRI